MKKVNTLLFLIIIFFTKCNSILKKNTLSSKEFCTKNILVSNLNSKEKEIVILNKENEFSDLNIQDIDFIFNWKNIFSDEEFTFWSKNTIDICYQLGWSDFNHLKSIPLINKFQDPQKIPFLKESSKRNLLGKKSCEEQEEYFKDINPKNKIYCRLNKIKNQVLTKKINPFKPIEYRVECSCQDSNQNIFQERITTNCDIEYKSFEESCLIQELEDKPRLKKIQKVYLAKSVCKQYQNYIQKNEVKNGEKVICSANSIHILESKKNNTYPSLNFKIECDCLFSEKKLNKKIARAECNYPLDFVENNCLILIPEMVAKESNFILNETLNEKDRTLQSRCISNCNRFCFSSGNGNNCLRCIHNCRNF